VLGKLNFIQRLCIWQCFRAADHIIIILSLAATIRLHAIKISTRNKISTICFIKHLIYVIFYGFIGSFINYNFTIPFIPINIFYNYFFNFNKNIKGLDILQVLLKYIWGIILSIFLSQCNCNFYILKFKKKYFFNKFDKLIYEWKKN